MNPFIGLRPFSAEDMDFYNGRELDTSIIETKIRLSPLTLMFARSGVGKSSFITCRLIEKLKEASHVKYINEWGQQNPEIIIENGIKKLKEYDIEDDREFYPVLILDQFEDVFKESGNRSLLWGLFARLNSSIKDKVHILISMREEWLGAWSGEVLDYLPNSFDSIARLSPLNDIEIKAAIAKPIELESSISIDESTVQVIIKDLKRPSAFGLADKYVEPGLLQLVCNRLWEEAIKNNKIINDELYNNLTGADAIIRDHVWRRIGKVGKDNVKSPFNVFDRLIWVGITKKLVAAHGVKSSVTIGSICSLLKMEDFGIAGVAFIKTISSESRAYLELSPENRGGAPIELLSALEKVMEKAVSVGFLKKQKSLLADQIHYNTLYEYSHDALADVFSLFAIEYETWINSKLAILSSIVIIVFIILPIASQYLFLLDSISLAEVISILAITAGISIIYIIVGWIILKISRFLIELISLPILRWLAKGEVQLNLKKINARKRKAINSSTNFFSRILLYIKSKTTKKNKEEHI